MAVSIIEGIHISPVPVMENKMFITFCIYEVIPLKRSYSSVTTNVSKRLLARSKCLRQNSTYLSTEMGGRFINVTDW